MSDRDVDEYVAHSRRRAALGNLVQAGLLFLLVGAFVAWRLCLLYDRWSGSDRPPPAAVIRVLATGTLAVDGCPGDASECMTTAKDRERNRPGGGRTECVIAPVVGAPEAAIAEALGACFGAGFLPTQLPPRAAK